MRPLVRAGLVTLAHIGCPGLAFLAIRRRGVSGRVVLRGRGPVRGLPGGRPVLGLGVLRLGVLGLAVLGLAVLGLAVLGLAVLGLAAGPGGFCPERSISPVRSYRGSARGRSYWALPPYCPSAAYGEGSPYWEGGAAGSIRSSGPDQSL